jgi:hypothetical protein
MAQRTLFRSLVALFFAVVAWLLPAMAFGQVFVRPRRAFKSEVRYFEFEWLHLDMLERPEEGGGGMRFFFYEREREVAERAAAFIAEGYEYLHSRFGYYPSQRFPYILYNTYQEFLETNVFPIAEGVLGVTSTQQDLTLTLPYLGDHRRFREVSTHELAHQYTIQKVRDFARAADVGNPLDVLPLWFVEGLAEFYAHRGLDDETEMLSRDLVVSPDVMKGYIFLDFFEERYGSFLWTYKLGQARCAFLEETYGDGILQEILEATPRLVRDDEQAIAELPDDPNAFAALLRTLTGDDAKLLAARFEEWLKRRSFRTFLEADQGAVEIERLEVNGHSQVITSMSASPSGQLMMARRIDPDTGQSSLVVFDARAPQSEKRVAEDGVPGVESLHPISDRNFDVSDSSLVFVAQFENADVIYRQTLRHEAVKQELGVPEVPGPAWQRRGKVPEVWDIQLELEERDRFNLGPHGLIAAESLALSPSGQDIAFVGIDARGIRDIYVLSGTPEAPDMRRLTDDPFAEREVSWGPRGIVFSSDATDHHKFNLFLADPTGVAAPTRLTTDDRDHFDPRMLPDGRIVFVAYDHARANIHEVTPDGVARRTDVATGLFDVAPAPNGGISALLFQSGEYRPVRVRRQALQLFARRNGEPPLPTPTLSMRSLEGAEEYEAFAKENWQVGNIFGILGASGSDIFGQVLATANDRLRNHVLVLNVAVLGQFELTDGSLLYINQENRIDAGFGAFQFLTFRNDRTFDDLPFRFTSIERFFGVLGLVRYPFNTFQYAEADVAVGGVRYFLEEPTRTFLADPELNDTGRDLLNPWDEAHDQTRLQAQSSLRFGHDTIRYHRGTGPLAGSSLLLEGTVTTQPEIEEVFGDVRLDGERYFALGGSANFFARIGAGTTLGGELAPEFYLSSFDTLRGVNFGDADFLLGREFFYSTLELQLPLNRIIRVVFLPNIEGVAGFDFGAVGEDWETIWDKRVLNGVLGFNMIFGPLVLRLHFAKPIDIDADPVEAGVARTGPGEDWVTNFSLGWLYF